MKTLRRLLVLFIVSVIIASAIYFMSDDVVVSSWATKIGEIGAVTVPVFIVVALLYFINRVVVKSVKGIAKKSLPKKEGQNN